MQFISTINKLITRKKTNGYYEASQALTPSEKQSLFIGATSILVPLLVTFILIITN